MTGSFHLPEKLGRAVYQTMKTMEMSEVPLVIADEPDQWEYLQSLPTMVGGAVVYASAPDAAAQALDSVGEAGYLFLVLDEEMAPRLAELVRYYLITRDPLDDGDASLERRLGPIHADHRLGLVCDRAVSGRVERWIRERVTAIALMPA